MNLTVESTTDQVINFVKQMPPQEKRAVLLAIAEEAETDREKRLDEAEMRLRQLCFSRGLDWDTMTEDEREAFVDDLIHEDRQCNP